MWLEKFFQIIDKSFIGRFIDKRLDIVRATKPDRIYIENIRSFYNLNSAVAKTLCEMAVRENLFKKRIGVECPVCGKLINHYNKEDEIPEKIECETCLLLEKDKHEFRKSEMPKIEFYQINKTVI